MFCACLHFTSFALACIHLTSFALACILLVLRLLAFDLFCACLHLTSFEIACIWLVLRLQAGEDPVKVWSAGGSKWAGSFTINTFIQSSQSSLQLFTIIDKHVSSQMSNSVRPNMQWLEYSKKVAAYCKFTLRMQLKLLNCTKLCSFNHRTLQHRPLTTSCTG